jgi:uncharacterized protein with PIN domain
VRVRCYAELNEFLPPHLRHAEFGQRCGDGETLAGLLAELGIPAAEVDLALVDGRALGFDDRLRHGERVALYPMFEALDIAAVTRLPGRPLRVTRFVLDAHLGRTARLLRLLGFDALYRPGCADGELVRLATEQRRILLTRDRLLLCDPALSHGYHVRARWPEAQAAEVLARFDLLGQVRPFTRCLLCNGEIAPVGKQEVSAQLPERTRRAFDRFTRCTGCGKVYWEGSHHEAMTRIVARLTGAAALP